MPSRILLVYNTSIQQSVDDLAWLIALRGYPENTLGVNFGTTAGAVTISAMQNTLKVQSLKWGGVADTFQDGVALQTALFNIAAKYAPDCVVFLTYTPVAYLESANQWTTLTGRFSQLLTPSDLFLTDVLPHGRYGCPATAGAGPSTGFNFNTELVGRSGTRVFEQAVTNAIAAEQQYNFARPLVASTGPADLLSPSLGLTQPYFAASMAQARARCPWTIDIGSSYLYADFKAGTMQPPLVIFGLCVAMSLNTGADPGNALYSNNYTVPAGGWSAHWYSFQWYWAMDFLYSGGSSALMTVGEPLADGIRDPSLILPQMLAGASLAEVLPRSRTPNSSPVYPVNSAYPGRAMSVGDPLYRPYAVQLAPPGAAAFGFM